MKIFHMSNSARLRLCVFGFILGSLVGPAWAEDPDVFQATIRGNAVSGVVVFSQSGLDAFSGDVVVFLKGRQFKGKSQGRVEGGKMRFSFEASAAAEALLPSRSLTGSFEATGGPQKFYGSGSILVSWEKNPSLAIKVSGIKNPGGAHGSEKSQRKL